MPQPRYYATAAAFRNALEERLKATAKRDLTDLNRLRRKVAFDRLLARLFQAETPPWALKGGYALELRFKSARSTVDIDLTLQSFVAPTASTGDINRDVRELLQNAATVSLSDWFEFNVGLPIMDLTAAPYGGARYPIEARMDGRIFARFHLDIGLGDVIINPLEVIECQDWLEFAAIKPAQVRMISCEQQFVEKIHAYTLPRNHANSRVKDLADLALLIGLRDLDRASIYQALHLTFERRATHTLPDNLPAPPPSWQAPFRQLAQECGLPTNLESVFNHVQEYFHNLLNHAAGR